MTEEILARASTALALAPCVSYLACDEAHRLGTSTPSTLTVGTISVCLLFAVAVAVAKRSPPPLLVRSLLLGTTVAGLVYRIAAVLILVGSVASMVHASLLERIVLGTIAGLPTLVVIGKLATFTIPSEEKGSDPILRIAQSVANRRDSSPEAVIDDVREELAGITRIYSSHAATALGIVGVVMGLIKYLYLTVE